jgi:uncharacterized protein YkwD
MMTTAALLFATALSAAAPSAAAETAQATYWMGSKVGNELKFDVQIPADVAAMIMNTKQAQDRGADTKPRYKKITHTINGVNMVFHSNEIAWGDDGLSKGELTWVVEAGFGAEWKNCDTTDPLYKGFAQAFKALSTELMTDWFGTRVYMVQGAKPAANLRLNYDGSYGALSPVAKAFKTLETLSAKSTFIDNERASIMTAFFTIANDARANPNYRKENNCKLFRELPAGLKPLRHDIALSRAAQNQAEYCAQVKEATHEQSDPDFADMGKRLAHFGVKNALAYEAAGGGSLADCPKIWMTSETHFRPWWNLDGEVVTAAGFGYAKADDGTWYFVAVLQ